MAACVLRDSEQHDLTREMAELRIVPTLAAAGRALGEGLGEQAQALLAVALDFACWRALAASSGSAAPAELMAEAMCALDR